jgi:hypothetical protein
MTKPAGGNAHWTGNLNRNRALLMVGVVQFTQGEEVYYYEDMYNREKGNRLEMRSRAICYPKNVEESRTAPPPQEPLMRKGQADGSPTPKRVIAAPPSQVMAKDSVPIYHTGTKVMVDVLVGGNPVRMVLDTGAEMMQVSQDLADKIVREGQGSWGTWQTFVMADGRKVKQQTINIESVKIGGHIVRNVPCSISSDGAPIMAFPIINAIGPFKIDTRNNELVFEPKVEAKG